jgi:hypothetical protein
MNLRTLVAACALTGALVLGVAHPAGATSQSDLKYALRTLAEHMSDMYSGVAAGNTAAVGEACSAMWLDAAHVETLSRPRGIPRNAWGHLMNAMADVTGAATKCQDGVDGDTVDQASLHKAAAWLRKANAEAAAVRRAISH